MKSPHIAHNIDEFEGREQCSGYQDIMALNRSANKTGTSKSARGWQGARHRRQQSQTRHTCSAVSCKAPPALLSEDFVQHGRD